MRPSSLMRRAAGSGVRRTVIPSRPAIPVGGTERAAVSAVLGRDHPLTRAVDSLEVLARQSLAVAAVLIGSVIEVIEHVGSAFALAASAGLVLVILTIRAAICTAVKRDHAVDLISQGREGLPIAAVQRQRQRLGRSRTREQLALAVQAIIRDAKDPVIHRMPRARPLFDAAVVASAAEDLQSIIRLLQADSVSVRGVARLEQLVTDGTSPLYGGDTQPLRQELDRIRQTMIG
jgi:hypothetical protein